MLQPPPPKGRPAYQDQLEREWAEEDRREARDMRVIFGGSALALLFGLLALLHHG